MTPTKPSRPIVASVHRTTERYPTAVPAPPRIVAPLARLALHLRLANLFAARVTGGGAR